MEVTECEGNYIKWLRVIWRENIYIWRQLERCRECVWQWRVCGPSEDKHLGPCNVVRRRMMMTIVRRMRMRMMVVMMTIVVKMMRRRRQC